MPLDKKESDNKFKTEKHFIEISSPEDIEILKKTDFV